MTATASTATQTPVGVGRPLPQNLVDWPRLVYPDNPRPVAVDGTDQPLAEDVVRQFQAYNSRVGPLMTDDVIRVRRAIEQAHFENEHSSLAGQRCVVVDGPPLVGKTHAVLSVAFRETREIWNKHPPVDLDPHADSGDDHDGGASGERVRRIPWSYIEISAASRQFGVLSGIHRFCGIPQGSRDKASDLLARLRHIAPHIGLRGVIIDDAHGIAGGRQRESALLADILKSVITGLPATVVIIGANLGLSGVLDGSLGEQVRGRSLWTELGNWPVPSKGKPPGPWERLASNLTKHLAFPGGPAQRHLDRRSTVMAIAEGSHGRPGLAIEWVKAAANHAIAHDTVLDVVALEATHRDWEGKAIPR